MFRAGFGDSDERGTVEAKPHSGGQSAKLNSEQMALVALLVEFDNDATLVELCDRLEEKALCENKSSHNGENHPKAESNPQKKTTHASERYTERVEKLRAEYWTAIGAVNLADLVFIDEASVNSWLKVPGSNDDHKILWVSTPLPARGGLKVTYTQTFTSFI